MFYNLYNRAESEGLGCSQFSEDFTVHVHPRLSVRPIEVRITHRILSNTSLDTLDPQLVPLPPFSLAIAISILPGLVHSSDSDAVAIFRASSKTFGVL